MMPERFFEKCCGRRDFKCNNSDINESTKMRGRFSDTVDRAVNFTHCEIKAMQRYVNREKMKIYDFTWKLNLKKTTRRRKRIHYRQEVTMNSAELTLYFTISGFDTVLLEWLGLDWIFSPLLSPFL